MAIPVKPLQAVVLPFILKKAVCCFYNNVAGRSVSFFHTAVHVSGMVSAFLFISRYPTPFPGPTFTKQSTITGKSYPLPCNRAAHGSEDRFRHTDITPYICLKRMGRQPMKKIQQHEDLL